MTESLSMNQTFIKKLTEIVLADLSVENFGAEKLAKEAGMSRVNLYRKLRSAKQEDISHFIREVRLKRAMEMLLNQEGTASEIAFKVGFSSPAYFNKCFHDKYGYPPGEIKKRDPVSLENVPNDELAAFTGSSLKSEYQKNQLHLERRPGYRNIMLISAVILSGLLLFFFIYNSISNLPGSPVKDGLIDPAKSIIVIPFENIGDDKWNQNFADGMMDEILNNLHRINGLRVVTSITAEQLRNTNLTAPEIARKLNVDCFLNASIQRYDNIVRINVQICDARKDKVLWSNLYDKDRELTGVYSFQSDIAFRITNAVDSILLSGEIGNIEKTAAKNPKAHK